jgi:Fe-Mn family superoxide dismutase
MLPLQEQIWKENQLKVILEKCIDIPAVRNNGGGFYNHNLFWTIMAPNAGGQPTGELAAAIDTGIWII